MATIAARRAASTAATATRRCRRSRTPSPSSRAPRRRGPSRRAWARWRRSVLALCSPGDHIVAQRQLYAGHAAALPDRVPPLRHRRHVRRRHRARRVRGRGPARARRCWCFAETPANPRLDLVDLDELGAIAGPFTRGRLDLRHAARPAAARPRRRPRAALGHQGASPATTTPRSASSPASAELIDWLWSFAVLQGANASPVRRHERPARPAHARPCDLRQQTETAPAARRAPRRRTRRWPTVRYPGLDSHPQHDLAKRQMTIGGGLLHVRPRRRARGRAARSSRATQVAQLATSLGGPETLVTHPASTTHVSLTPDELAPTGIGAGHDPGVGRPRARRRRDRRLQPGPRGDRPALVLADPEGRSHVRADA